MPDTIQSIPLGEIFEPNCLVKVRGEHYFTDKKLYSNMYGISFFTENGSFDDNPHISPACEKLPGILDDYFSDSVPESSHARENFEIRDAIMANIPARFKQTPARKKEQKTRIGCAFPGQIFRSGKESVVLQYGTLIPATMCITGENIVSMSLPFSPFSNLSFVKGERTFQTVDYPILTEPFVRPEGLTIDFSVSVKKMEIALSPDLFGTICLEYSIDVGVTKCESSKIVFDITREDELI